MGDVTRGIVLWEGPSPLDGAPLVCVATWGSRNRKTGALVQTWIIRTDVEPHVAVGTGQDAAVCGTCPHRPFLGGDCYVSTVQAPLSVFRAYQRGRYPRRGDAAWGPLHARLMRGGDRPVRAGSYGDPALVPADVWARLHVVTGYTHQWRMPWAQAHRAWFMASADGPGDRAAAHAAGWRTFTVAPVGQAGDAADVACPSVTRGVACVDCGLCGGMQRAGAKSVWIAAHGARAGASQEGRGLLRILM